jgi:stearoyl-CoA desaturase (delta-9 desaturase)
MGKLNRTDLLQSTPFFFMHAACLLVFWVGWSWPAVVVAVMLYAVRVFALTAFYHRYFSHRAFKTSRWFQFVWAVVGSMAVQRGPIWWAAHHRDHHRHSDDEQDVHSPLQRGFLWSHVLWFLTHENYSTKEKNVRDWLKFSELRFLDRHYILLPAILAGLLFLLGWSLAEWVPEWGTSGLQMVVWGFFISTVAVYHVTFSINSLAHLIGRRRFPTNDHSRNNFLLAMLSFGEGWHNNHHFYQASARQGFYWWEVDLSFYLLRLLSWFGLVWDLKGVPERILAQGRRGKDDSV